MELQRINLFLFLFINRVFISLQSKEGEYFLFYSAV